MDIIMTRKCPKVGIQFTFRLSRSSMTNSPFCEDSNFLHTGMPHIMCASNQNIAY